MTKLEKVVEMYDPQGMPTNDPSKAARTITTIYEDGKVVRRMLGKPLIPTGEYKEE